MSVLGADQSFPTHPCATARKSKTVGKTYSGRFDFLVTIVCAVNHSYDVEVWMLWVGPS